MIRSASFVSSASVPLETLLSVGEEARIDRLVLAAAQQIADRGAAGASARSVAAAAGVAASAVNYNFGNVERLFSSAFEFGAGQTAEWLEARSAEILMLPRTAGGAVLALEYLVAAWTREARALALLYQECLASTPGQGPGAAWTGLWRDFWIRTAAAFGLSEVEGRILHLFFESEGLYHLSGWSRALEGAALRELCAHLGAVWLGAGESVPVGAAQLAERSAGARPVGSIAPAALRIAEAAAEVVEARGLGGLTHRAVATAAGVTTGAVTHHFRTIEDLVAGAIRGQVEAMSRSGEADGPPPPQVEQIRTPEDLLDAIRFHAMTDQPAGPGFRRRTLFLAAVRRPELASAGAVIRFAHGGTIRDALGRLFAIPPEMISLHAGVLARLVSAIWFAASADAAPRQAQALLVGEVGERLLRWLSAREAA